MQHSIQRENCGPFAEPIERAVSACVHCGFCLAACPTYRELGQEMDSPRGRIVLMKEVLEGSMTAEQAAPHIDACLGCLACEPACPSGVAYRDLISPYRALTADAAPRSMSARIRRALAAATIPRPRVFRAAARAGMAVAKFPAPSAFRPMLDLLPNRPLPRRQKWPEKVAPSPRRRARVALLTGCAQDVLAPSITAAALDVLAACGIEVVIPRRQVCCGALSWHVGDLDAARRFARGNLDAFPSDVDAVVTTAAGCGSGMREYHLILRGTDREDDADRFRRKVMDVTVAIETLGALPDLAPLDPNRSARIAYHDACHLGHGQNVRAEPRRLLRRIPNTEVLEIRDPHLCCGSAGTYNIDHPVIAAKLGRSKAQSIAELNPDLVATGNIGCLTQLQRALATETPAPPKLQHTIEIIRDALPR